MSANTPNLTVLKRVISAARGEMVPDLLLVNGKVVNVFNGEIEETSVAVQDGVIAGLGSYRQGKEVVDLQGSYLIPGLIDSHIHIESSMLAPPQFAAAAVPHGTTTVLADPHEIVNVAGLDGWLYMIQASRGLPMDFLFTVPSCVPATHMETAGAAVGIEEVRKALAAFPDSPALAEMMNYPGVLNGNEAVLGLIQEARMGGRAVDGHAPSLSGFDLNAYIAAGITSDHECTTASEALEKISRGMMVLIREGSAARNLEALLPVVNIKNWPSLAFCCDDRHPGDLLREGEMDHILRKAVGMGLSPIQAIRMATITPALHYRLTGKGAVAPGYFADLVVINELHEFQVEKVFYRGELVAQDGKLARQIRDSELTVSLIYNSVNLPEVEGRFKITRPEKARLARVIQVVPEQILTIGLQIPVDEALSSPDICRAAVVERHGRSGSVGLGLVRGFGLQRGAIASTVAHDSHNLVIIGRDEASMENAARAVREMGGGMAVVDGDEVLAALPLPVAGLMSNRSAQEVAEGHEELQQAARRLGCQLPAPFMTMSFISLPVIPELRLTDRGLVDVEQFAPVDLWIY